MKAYFFIILALVIATPLAGQTKKEKGGAKPPLEQSVKTGEEDTMPPLNTYKGKTFMAVEVGKLKVELASLKGFSKGGDTDYFQHITDSKVKCKEYFDAALKTVKKAKAKEALKSYHVAFLGSLLGIMPGNEELVRDYKRRQQVAEEKMNDAWARFEVEE